MKSIKLTSPDGGKFELIAYKAGETVEVFKGATGIFGRGAGSKTAGIVYVTHGPGGISAEDCDVDSDNLWNWIAQHMQAGLNNHS